MRCSSCQFENVEHRKFCSECGTLLPHGCPNCGVVNAATAKFCGECGVSLKMADGSPITETRTVREQEAAGEPPFDGAVLRFGRFDRDFCAARSRGMARSRGGVSSRCCS